MVGAQRTLKGSSAEGMVGVQLLHRTRLKRRHGQVFADLWRRGVSQELQGPADGTGLLGSLPIVLGHVGMGVHWLLQSAWPCAQKFRSSRLAPSRSERGSSQEYR